MLGILFYSILIMCLEKNVWHIVELKYLLNEWMVIRTFQRQNKSSATSNVFGKTSINGYCKEDCRY